MKMRIEIVDIVADVMIVLGEDGCLEVSLNVFDGQLAENDDH